MLKSPLLDNPAVVGIAGSGKAANAKTAAASMLAQDKLEGARLVAPKGGKLYGTDVPMPLSLQHSVGFLNFTGGFYATSDEDEMKTLAHFIKQGLVYIVESNE